jgi:protein-L-isoaspartate O-methyltransferase
MTRDWRLSEAPRDEDGTQCLLSICAGEGRDVLPVLAELDRAPVRALLLEIDPTLAERARAAASDLRLNDVGVRVADAGATDSYLHESPAHVIMACGVFGNVSLKDVKRTVLVLPELLADSGVVVWTRAGQQPSQIVRRYFLEGGFAERTFSGTPDGMFRVGLHQLTIRPTGAGSGASPGQRRFRFT